MRKYFGMLYFNKLNKHYFPDSKAELRNYKNRALSFEVEKREESKMIDYFHGFWE